MVLRIQRIGDGLGVMLPAEALEAMQLGEGAAVEVMAPEVQVLPAPGQIARDELQYADDEEVLGAFFATEPDHRDSYRELAK